MVFLGQFVQDVALPGELLKVLGGHILHAVPFRNVPAGQREEQAEEPSAATRPPAQARHRDMSPLRAASLNVFTGQAKQEPRPDP
jgi:hypothetical protein